jgi:hypothetical protein
MLLVAVNDVGPSQLAKQCATDRVRALLTNQPRVADHAHSKPPDQLFATLCPEAHQRRRNDVGHVSRKLASVAFSATNDAVGAKQGGNEVDDAHRLLQYFELEV